MKNTMYEILFCCLAMTAATGWYHFYVAPNDVMLNDVITCMDGDQSRLAYDHCFEEYIEAHR
jgi:hypothetical protein